MRNAHRHPAWIIAAIGWAVILGSCSASDPAQENVATNRIAEVSVTNEDRAEPCPPEQLSCGRQHPITSDGVTAFRNEEMGIAALFPAGSQVCMSRSGDAPRGFYARYGTDEPGCPEREDGDARTTFMGIGSSFNPLFYRTLREAAGEDCQPPGDAVLRRLGRPPLAIAGHGSLVCQSMRPNGLIEISVYAMAGRWPDNDPEGVPYAIYWASLGTREDRLEQDVRMFRTFLNRLHIGLTS